MVGVAGKSKGCNTCRQRRIKCSLERPHCAQCLKSNFRCTGYQRERIFVVNDRTSMKSRQVPSAKRTVSSGDRKPKKPARTAGDKRPSAGRMIRGTPPKIIIQASPSPHASYRLQLLSEFLKSYIPVEQLGPLEDRPWFLLVPTLPSITRALEVTTMAVCTAKLGRLNKNQAMISDSLRFYTQGLSEVQKALWDPALMYSDETLAASMALAMYELTECPAASKVGYISHHKGCVRLVQLRGPEAHTSGLAHQVFLTFRIQAILDALEPHHSTYLSDAAWMDRPWRERPKRPMDVLFDHVAQAPAIFNQVQTLRSLQPHEVLPTTLQIITKCWEMDDKLRLFYDNLESSSLGPLYWPEFSKVESIFPVAFHFSDLNTANMLMLYWATLTMLWSGLSKLYELLSSLAQMEMDSGGLYDSGPSYHISRLRPLDHRVRYISMARNVCQSVEYCIQDQMLGFGPSMAVAPLTILTETLRDDPNFAGEMLWIKETFKTIDAQGIKILSHV